MKHREQIDKIDQYHTGQMTPEEQLAFEKELSADPSLKAESDFQSEIITGLREYRKLQLKSRLDAIEITTGWLEFAQQSTLVKSFGGVVIASAIGTGVYYIAEKDELPQIESDKIEMISAEQIEVAESEEIAFEWTLEAAQASAQEKVRPQNLQVEEVSSTVVVSETVGAIEGQEAETKEFTPVFEAPSASEVDDLSLNTSELDEVESSTAIEESETPLDIEAVNTKAKKIKYKYYDGKLYLTGNFENKPYEIIEINGASGRRIYLLHNRKYYEVSITDRLTELKEVRNIKIIQELRLIKANK